MRITYIHQHFRVPTQAGGTRSWEFARRLAVEGHAVTMICGGTVRRTFREQGFKVVQLPVSYSNSMGTARRIVAFLRFMASATWVALATPADVVLASSTPLTVAVPGVVAATIRRASFVLEVRDLWPEVPIALGALHSKISKFLAQRLEAVAYSRAVRIIALSPGMRDGVLRIRPSAHVTVIPNACDRELFDIPKIDRLAFRQANGWGANELVVVYAGSLGRVYDAQWSVKTAAHFVGEDVRFILIGDGALRESCVQLADQLGLDSGRLLLGPLSKYETAQYVASADLALSTSISEPTLEPASLNKVFDALAAGRPVIFNHEGWLSDLLCQNEAGWKLSRDPRAAADQIRHIAASREEVLLARERSRELAETHFLREDLYITFRNTLLDASRSRTHG